MSSMAGKMIDEFRLIEEIGRGGMGVVYRAVHDKNGYEAAIKILPIALSQDAIQFQLFRREAQIAKAVTHANLVRVEASGQLADGTLYLRMELLRGLTLKQELQHSHQSRLPPKQALLVSMQVANALQVIHEKHIVHRDLKPSNVMLVAPVDGPMQAKLLDFGLARFLRDASQQELTVTGHFRGTPRYMSPEQCRGAKELGPASDLYSLGLVLFESLTGLHPLAWSLTESSVEALLQMHRNRKPVSLQQLWPDAPAELVRLLDSLLDKEPQRRPTAFAVATALAALEPGMPIAAPSSFPPPDELRAALTEDITNPPRDPSLEAMVAATGVRAFQSGSQSENSPVALRTGASSAAAGPPKTSGNPRRLVLLVVFSGCVLTLGSWLIVGSPRQPSIPGWKRWLGSLRRNDVGAMSSSEFEKIPMPQDHDEVPQPPAGMAYLPGGKFRQGSSAEQVKKALQDCESIEGTCKSEQFERELGAREVTMRPFFMDQVEITNQAFIDWLNNPLRKFQHDSVEEDVRLRGQPIIRLSGDFTGISYIDGKYLAKPGRALQPVVQVTWYGARTYCQQQGKDLPTEAQWEFAASNGGTTQYPWGNTPPQCKDQVALGRDKLTNCPPLELPSVGTMSFDVNKYGVHDLAGSVSEWGQDRFVQPYRSCDDCVDPIAKGGSEDSTPSENPIGEYRVIRGSNLINSRVLARAAMRSRATATDYLQNVGFRCAAQR